MAGHSRHTLKGRSLSYGKDTTHTTITQITQITNVRVRQRGGLRVIRLLAVCSALDVDDPQPAITVMCPDED